MFITILRVLRLHVANGPKIASKMNNFTGQKKVARQLSRRRIAPIFSALYLLNRTLLLSQCVCIAHQKRVHQKETNAASIVQHTQNDCIYKYLIFLYRSLVRYRYFSLNVNRTLQLIYIS